MRTVIITQNTVTCASCVCGIHLRPVRPNSLFLMPHATLNSKAEQLKKGRNYKKILLKLTLTRKSIHDEQTGLNLEIQERVVSPTFCGFQTPCQVSLILSFFGHSCSSFHLSSSEFQDPYKLIVMMKRCQEKQMLRNLALILCS